MDASSSQLIESKVASWLELYLSEGSNYTPNTADLMALQSEHAAKHYAYDDVVMSRRNGMYLTDSEGRECIDGNGTYSACADPDNVFTLGATAFRQILKLTHVQNKFLNEQQPLLLELLDNVSGLPVAVFMNSGAEAFDTVVKASRRYGYRVKGVKKNKAKIIVAKRNFHGRTLCAISASSERKYQEDFGPLVPGFIKIAFGDIAALEKYVSRPDVVAFIVEVVQGEGGVHIANQHYWRAVQALCAKHNVLIVFDEVQTGLGRTGALFCHQHYGLTPDMMMLAKAFAQVLPASAVLGKKHIMDIAFEPGSHGSTFGGNPVSCAVARKSIELIMAKRDLGDGITGSLVENSRDVGGYLLDQLKDALRNNPNVIDIRGKGLLIGIELNKKLITCEYLRQKTRDKLLIGGAAGSNTYRLSPPLTAQRKHADEMTSIVVESLPY